MLDFLILEVIELRMNSLEAVPSTIEMDPLEETDIRVGTIVKDDLRRLWLVCNLLSGEVTRIEIELRATQSDPGRNARKIVKLNHLRALSNTAHRLFESEMMMRFSLPPRPTILRSDWSIVIDQKEERRAERNRARSRDICGND